MTTPSLNVFSFLLLGSQSVRCAMDGFSSYLRSLPSAFALSYPPTLFHLSPFIDMPTSMAPMCTPAGRRRWKMLAHHMLLILVGPYYPSLSMIDAEIDELPWSEEIDVVKELLTTEFGPLAVDGSDWFGVPNFEKLLPWFCSPEWWTIDVALELPLFADWKEMGNGLSSVQRRGCCWIEIAPLAVDFCHHPDLLYSSDSEGKREHCHGCSQKRRMPEKTKDTIAGDGDATGDGLRPNQICTPCLDAVL
ncbi:hypothetical protein ACLOJK_010547 [Asimina triloba]